MSAMADGSISRTSMGVLPGGRREVAGTQIDERLGQEWQSGKPDWRGQHYQGWRFSQRRSAAEQFGDPEGEVKGLPGVEARVAQRLVADIQIGVEDFLGAAQALGDVVPGELDVDPA